MVRMRLYDALSLVPAHFYEASYTQLLRLLVAEFTLADNPANTTTSLLQVRPSPPAIRHVPLRKLVSVTAIRLRSFRLPKVCSQQTLTFSFLRT